MTSPPWPHPVPGARRFLLLAPFLLLSVLSWGLGSVGWYNLVGALFAAGLLGPVARSAWRVVALGVLLGGVLGALYGRNLSVHPLDGMLLGWIPGATLGAGWGTVAAQWGRARSGVLDAEGRSLWALVALLVASVLVLLPFSMRSNVVAEKAAGPLLLAVAAAVAGWVSARERSWRRWWRGVQAGSLPGLRVGPAPEGPASGLASLPLIFASRPSARVDGELIAFLQTPPEGASEALWEEPPAGGYRAAEGVRAVLRVQQVMDAKEGRLRWREGFRGGWLVMGGALFVACIAGLMLGAAVFVITVGGGTY